MTTPSRGRASVPRSGSPTTSLVVGEAASGEEAVDRARELTPDVVFMDVRMPGMDGIEATRQILQAAPETKVILITIDESRGAISQAIQAGVSGYLLKDASADALVDAARNAIEGNAVIHPQLTTDVHRRGARMGDAASDTTPLSKREREILQTGGRRRHHQAGREPIWASRRTRSRPTSSGSSRSWARTTARRRSPSRSVPASCTDAPGAHPPSTHPPGHRYQQREGSPMRHRRRGDPAAARAAHAGPCHGDRGHDGIRPGDRDGRRHPA